MGKWIQRVPKRSFKKNDDIRDKIASIRGIEDIDRFLNPQSEELHNARDMKNIVEASNRIAEAIKNNENIVVSIDPDSDGITSGVMMIKYLENYTDNVRYIYSQRRYGHGISAQIRLNFVSNEDVDDEGDIIDEDKKERYEHNCKNLEKVKNSDLLIIIDSSTNSDEYCNSISAHTDIVIIDHHTVENENPNALIVNPQQEDCTYPNKDLSAAGVVLKVLEVIDDIHFRDSKNRIDPYNFIDLAAVGIYGDVMPINSYENRYIILHGLRNIKNIGLLRILKGGKVDLFKINSDAIGFTIAPMLNGAARMGQIELAIQILLTDDDNIAKKLRLQIHKLNEKRKIIQKEKVEYYESIADLSKNVIFVFDENSNKDFNGLIAQQLASKYKRPVFVGTRSEGKLLGSYRSFNKFDVGKCISNYKGHAEAHGHPLAGGFGVLEEDEADFLSYMYDKAPKVKHTEETFVYDLSISLDEVEESISGLEDLNKLTGNGFPKVLVRVSGIMMEEVNTIGKTEETRKFKTMGNLELIKFKVDKDYGKEIEYFDTIEAIGQLHLNEFFNFGLRKKICTPQIMLQDYRKI